MDPASLQVIKDLDKVREGAPDPVELESCQCVTLLQSGKSFLELRPGVGCTARHLDENVLRLTTETTGGVDLRIGALSLSRDPRVEDSFGH